MAYVRPDINSVVAHQRETRAEVRRVAAEIAGRASSRLAAHRRDGDHSVQVTHGAVDSLVELVGPGAISVEFGRGGGARSDGRNQGPMEGLRILRGALPGGAG